MRCCCGLAISYLQPPLLPTSSRHNMHQISRILPRFTCIPIYFQLHVNKTWIKIGHGNSANSTFLFLLNLFGKSRFWTTVFASCHSRQCFFANWRSISNTMKLIKGLAGKKKYPSVELNFAHQELEETLDLASSIILKLLWQHDNQVKVLGIRMRIVSW